MSENITLFKEVSQMMPVLVAGAVITVKLFIATLVISLPLGLPFALGENSRVLPIRWFSKFYVFVFRGSPLLLQLFFFYFLFPFVFNYHISAMNAAILTFSLNYAAYFAEIYRGGINSIDRGQYEASYSLGLTKGQTMKGIILPQMMRVVLPPIGNEMIVLVKDTALVSAIGVADLLKVSRGIVNREVNMLAYIVAVGIYLLMTFVLTVILTRVEKHFSKYDEVEE